jgi:hypothetical protein
VGTIVPASQDISKLGYCVLMSMSVFLKIIVVSIKHAQTLLVVTVAPAVQDMYNLDFFVLMWMNAFLKITAA